MAFTVKVLINCSLKVTNKKSITYVMARIFIHRETNASQMKVKDFESEGNFAKVFSSFHITWVREEFSVFVCWKKMSGLSSWEYNVHEKVGFSYGSNENSLAWIFNEEDIKPWLQLCCILQIHGLFEKPG